jgi:hypothetical protein
VQSAKTVRATHRPVYRAERPQAGQVPLDLVGGAGEVTARAASGWRAAGPDPCRELGWVGHWPSRVQNAANTCVDST